jgi:hypothetical protein
MHSGTDLQKAALSAADTVKTVLYISLGWFMVMALATGVVVALVGASVGFVLLAVLSAIAVLFSIIIGVRLVRDSLCRGASGVWTLVTDTPAFRLQILWLLLSGFLFAFALMAL